jgi:hypothetical protein
MTATGSVVTFAAMIATATRLTLAALAAVALAASASSKKTAPPPTEPAGAGAWNAAPPPSATLAPGGPTGLWKTTFGAVKIEDDGAGGVHGAWVYQRDGKDVVGYFGGRLDGNVLRLTWREPAQPQPGEAQLAGEGWLVFEATADRFSGRWWTTSRDRQGDWTGTRSVPTTPPPVAPGAMGGDAYGGVVGGP